MNFEQIKKQADAQWANFAGRDRPRVLVGTATCGRAAGALEVLSAFEDEFRRRPIPGGVQTVEVGCHGLCYGEPFVEIRGSDGRRVLYQEVEPGAVPELVESHVRNGRPVLDRALAVMEGRPLEGLPRFADLPATKNQVRMVLRNCGHVDPTKIDHYIANGGYSGLVGAMQMGPERIIEQIKASGLRGRGGAGFPTWRKWQFSREAKGTSKYLICNGSEGDPGTFSNKLLFESDPHSVLEGILIAAFAIGAEEGYVYCPAEYPLALERLRAAVRQMEEYGLLGDGILGSSLNFRLKLKVGAGAYICGEESALIECIEGKRGTPRVRPPFPPVSGLWNQPTIVNNVETLACVTLVLQNGASQFAELGTAASTGTKMFCLSGNLKRSGVIEVPFGITLREIVCEIGGGTPDGRPVKAVQTGGPAGACLPPSLFDVPVDHDSLLEFGASIGSGGMIVIDQRSCAVDLARYFLTFAENESCGKCVPCRMGTQHMLRILTDITEGRGRPEMIRTLKMIGETMGKGSFCGLGQTAANPVLSTLRYFLPEYETHVQDKNCPAGVCRLLT